MMMMIVIILILSSINPFYALTHITQFQMSCSTYYSKMYNKQKTTHKKSNKKRMITMMMIMTITTKTSHHHCHNLLFLIKTVHSLRVLQSLLTPYKFSHLSNAIIFPSCYENSLLSCHQNTF